MVASDLAPSPAQSAGEIDSQVDMLLRQPYRMIVQGDAEQGFVALVPELPGCFTAGETPDEAMALLRDAMAAWFETALLDGAVIPPPSPMVSAGQAIRDALAPHSGQLRLRMPRTLHAELAVQAERDGVSLNTLVVTYLARGLGAEHTQSRPA